MKYATLNALVVRTLLGEQPTQENKYTGKNAELLTEESSLRIYSRMMRQRYSTGRPTALSDLVKRSGQRRRSRNTHPGKRGRS